MNKELQTNLIENAIIHAHINTIEDALLGVCKELLTEEQYKALAKNFYEHLYQTTVKFLDSLPDVNQSVLVKEKFQAFEAMNRRVLDIDN